MNFKTITSTLLALSLLIFLFLIRDNTTNVVTVNLKKKQVKLQIVSNSEGLFAKVTDNSINKEYVSVIDNILPHELNTKKATISFLNNGARFCYDGTYIDFDFDKKDYTEKAKYPKDSDYYK